MSGTRGVQRPLGPATTGAPLKKPPLAAPTALSLGKLGSFKRNRTVKPAKETAAPPGPSRPRPTPPLFALEPFSANSSSYPSPWPQLQHGPPSKGGEVVIKRTSHEGKEGEAPWTTFLRRAANTFDSRDKGKGKQKETPETQPDDDEALVSERSWEAPSDRSTPPSHLDAAGPSASFSSSSSSRLHPHPARPPSPRAPVSTSRSLTRQPATVTAPLRGPAASSRSPNPSGPTPTTPPSSTAVRYPPKSRVPASVSSTWTILYIGGILSSLSDLKIFHLLCLLSLPQPVAMRISRPPGRYCPTFLAFSSSTQAREAIACLADQPQYDDTAIDRLTPKISDKPASSVTWYGSEMIESWRDAWRKATEDRQRKRDDQAVEPPSRVDSKPDTTLRGPSHPVRPGGSERRVPPPPPPPPPPPLATTAPSQVLVEALLSELRRLGPAPPDASNRPPVPAPPPPPRLTSYHATLDPRKRRKLA
ncbi:hypothetical protein JCM11491_004529 [Sporobolomyces phaffii]